MDPFLAGLVTNRAQPVIPASGSNSQQEARSRSRNNSPRTFPAISGERVYSPMRVPGGKASAMLAVGCFVSHFGGGIVSNRPTERG
jgi:hypothetical protein